MPPLSNVPHCCLREEAGPWRRPRAAGRPPVQEREGGRARKGGLGCRGGGLVG